MSLWTTVEIARVLLQWGHGSEAVEIDNISGFEETGS
jgi:hypothetical protein